MRHVQFTQLPLAHGTLPAVHDVSVRYHGGPTAKVMRHALSLRCFLINMYLYDITMMDKMESGVYYCHG